MFELFLKNISTSHHYVPIMFPSRSLYQIELIDLHILVDKAMMEFYNNHTLPLYHNFLCSDRMWHIILHIIYYSKELMQLTQNRLY